MRTESSFCSAVETQEKIIVEKVSRKSFPQGAENVGADLKQKYAQHYYLFAIAIYVAIIFIRRYGYDH